MLRKLTVSGLACLMGGVVLFSSLSCTPTADPLMDLLDTQLSSLKVDTLSRTMSMVVSSERFDKTQFEEKLAASLNRWAKSEEELMNADEWKVDPLAKAIAANYSELPSAGALDGLGFINTDSYFVQQNFWAKKLTERLAESAVMGPFEIYLGNVAVENDNADAKTDEDEEALDLLTQSIVKIHADLSEEDAVTLASTLKVFDWVIRNVHLLADDALVAGADNLDDLKLNASEDLAAAGVPGLGYTRFPAQVMLYSRGDYVERAKLFMTMVDQLGVATVMLVPKSEDGASGDARPWAVGANIGGKLFLFDTKLGLPIPGAESGAIATLEEARTNAEILDSLDLSVNESLKDATKYWVKAAQLKDLSALVYAEPESTSYRFWELESNLVGDTRMKLTVEPTAVIEKMPKLDGIEYGVWDIGYKTHQFRLALRDAIAESTFKDDIRDKISWYYSDEYYINEFVRYRTARSKYFNGLFETIRNDGNLNAIELFYSMIYKDSKIDSLMTDKIFQLRLRVTQGDLPTSVWQNTIRGMQANMKLVRRDSGLFLSQCHFDNGNFRTAANWLTRLEQVADTSRWQPAIDYLRARTLEAQRDYDSAVEIYNKQESEQFHGDLIRVRLLNELKSNAS